MHGDLRTRLRHVHTYAVTPFCADDLWRLDTAALERNVGFLVEQGVQVVAVAGGTGEFEALSKDEYVTIAKVALEAAAGKALVIATVPGNLAVARQLLHAYELLGIETVLGMPPLIRGRVPEDLAGTADYYRQLCAATAIPLMPYNTQHWPVAFYHQLADIDGILGVKDPCFAPHEMFKAIQQIGDRFVWIGNKQHDPGVVHLRYQMGMEAFTSGQSNFWPEPELAIHRAGQRQDWDETIRLQASCAPLERLRMLSDDAAMVKGAMDWVGLTGGRVRPPRRDITTSQREHLVTTLRELDVPRLTA